MIVLDASAVIDVVLNQPAGVWVLDQLAASDACAPAHVHAEILSAVARSRRAGTIEDDQAAAALRDAFEIPMTVVEPTLVMARRALELQDRLRVLDGLYVALAEHRECALVTTDRRLVGADAPCDVMAPPQSRTGS